jgi:tetratricopeptide (TPR) repeat protein
MADALPALPETTRDQLAGLISEYKQALKITEDNPATQIAQANLAMQQNQLLEAEQHFQRALQISPGFVPALLNFAEFLRNTNRNAASEQHLQKALSIAPDSAGAQHAWGLHLVRQQRIEDALPFLKIAATIADAQPRFSYVYAVALDSIGATDQALSHLKASDQRWPNQIDTLNALLIYADKQNELASHMQYLSKLSALSPSSPLVRRLMQKYQSR